MRRWLWIAAAAAAALAGAALAGEETTVVEGKEAPDFRLNDDAGKAVKLSAFRGKSWVVLAFFPKAMTGG